MKKAIVITLLALMLIHPTPVYAVEEEIPIPAEVALAAEYAGDQYGICPELLEAIAYHESRYTSDIVSGSCYGLMQVNLSSHKARLQKLNIKESDILDPFKNMIVAADYLAELFETYEDPTIVLAVYHGEKNYSADKPSKYVKSILEHSKELEKEHDAKLNGGVLSRNDNLVRLSQSVYRE